MTSTMGLALALCATGGIALALAIRIVRRQREYDRLDASAQALYHRLQAANDARDGLREQVAELGPALIDAQRRWGFDLGRWPEVRALVGDPSSAAVSWWLLQHAPGIDLLREGGRATDNFFSAFDGWRPPRLSGR